MFSKQFGALLLAFGGVVGAIQFNGPAPTPINKRWDANGWTPIPTSKPKPILELFRRQSDPAFCGYLEGDPGMFSHHVPLCSLLMPFRGARILRFGL